MIKQRFSWSLIIVLIGFFIRFLFLLFGAEFYYGKEDFYIGGDTNWWVVNVVNLIEHGVYTDSIGNEFGFFTRTPGYSFFIGIFYLLSGKDIGMALQLIPYFQLITDTVSIYFIYKIAEKIFKDKMVAIIVGLLYSFYPFIIIWDVVVYAESFSVFLMLGSLLLLIKAKTKWEYFFVGVVLSVAILTRIQLILIIPIFGFVILKETYKTAGILFNKYFIFFGISILLVYGSWPIRNYVNHNKIILSQHLGDRNHWSPDYIGFMDYIWSVKVDHNPQFEQIISNTSKVDFPIAAYAYPKDSVLIDEFVHLARTCGEGFSYFARTAKYRNDVVVRGEDCNDRLVEIFNTLVLHQKEHNSMSYYLLVPLGNLRKAIFKNQLYSPSGGFVAFVSVMLFLYRTILIFLGLGGFIYLYLKKRDVLAHSGVFVCLSYVIVWYLFQAFIYRNMEMRYLLHADVLLLIPAGYLLSHLFKKKTS